MEKAIVFIIAMVGACAFLMFSGYGSSQPVTKSSLISKSDVISIAYVTAVSQTSKKGCSGYNISLVPDSSIKGPTLAKSSLTIQVAAT